jgi:hypothetical protein
MSRACCVVKMLRELGIRSDFNSFKDRLLAQKIVYIAQTVFGIDFGYKFIWHIRGPYSKILSRDLRVSVDPTCRCPELSSESLGKLKSLINDLRSLDNDLSVSAEVLASYLMLSRDVYPRPEDPIKELISRKPYISYDDVQNILKIYSKYVV